jgi:hypothetical protein
MNTIRILLTLIVFTSCNSSVQKPVDTTTNADKSREAVASQYAIESNTMIFYDRSIADAIKARKFYSCIDVFSSEVYAKLIRPTSTLKFRVLSVIYDESQLLNIDLRQNVDLSPVDCHLLGYIVLENGLANGILEVINPQKEGKIELYVKDLKTDITNVMNMLNDNRMAMRDPMVNKKDNTGTIPFRRISVLHSQVYAKHSTNDSRLKVIDIYRPSELSRSFNNPPTSSQASWFAAATPVDQYGKISSGIIYYLKNPRIIEN